MVSLWSLGTLERDRGMVGSDGQMDLCEHACQEVMSHSCDSTVLFKGPRGGIVT